MFNCAKLRWSVYHVIEKLKSLYGLKKRTYSGEVESSGQTRNDRATQPVDVARLSFTITNHGKL